MATQSEIKDVRRRVGDKVKDAEDAFEYSGSNVFRLTFNNIISIAATVNGSATNQFTTDTDSGAVTMTGTLNAEDAVKFIYTYAAYTDAEITELVDEKGVVGATIEILRDLLADSAKMFDYSEGATDAKMSQIFNQVKSLLGIYKDELAKEENNQDKQTGGIAFGDRSHPLMDGTRGFYEDDLSRRDC